MLISNLQVAGVADHACEAGAHASAKGRSSLTARKVLFGDQHGRLLWTRNLAVEAKDIFAYHGSDKEIKRVA